MTSINQNRKSGAIIEKVYILVLITILMNQHCSLYHDSYDAEGYVVDSRTKIGIEGASVILSSGEQRNIEATTNTNSSGYFKLHINLGFDSSSAGILMIDKSGYKGFSKTIIGFSSSIDDSFALDPNN
jgi:hypothetical protein